MPSCNADDFVMLDLNSRLIYSSMVQYNLLSEFDKSYFAVFALWPGFNEQADVFAGPGCIS